MTPEDTKVYKRGDKVVLRKQTGVVLGEYIKGMYLVRIMDGLRYVGVVVVPDYELEGYDNEQ